ncbi:hypothetical protein MTR67_028164 [Solanum verrucosum]|uniref:Uncharacterized protein n=1 Tax=Solanum verrucosum TaxID=315347 RepID=A0AAF0TWE2_SOLVR|nr:hypothetical protein MTR67_028164 [Solanum verrucosum]
MEKGTVRRLQIEESIFRQQGANTSLNHVTRVLFCGPHFPDSQNFTREYLQHYPMIDDVPLENVSAMIGDYDICVVKNFEMNSDVISRAKNMKLIMQFGVGLDGVDINAATKQGIKVAKIPSGETGNAASFAEMVDERGSHDDILKFASKADIVVSCLPMTTETIGIVNNDFISAMKKGALLINIGRGGVLDYEAVYNNLKLGHLGGLGIDVVWTEPFDPLNPILQLPNVIITPHVAGVTQSSFRYMAKVVGDVALQLHAGKMSYIGIEIVN